MHSDWIGLDWIGLNGVLGFVFCVYLGIVFGWCVCFVAALFEWCAFYFGIWVDWL